MSSEVAALKADIKEYRQQVCSLLNRATYHC